MANVWALLVETVPFDVLVLYLFFDRWQRKRRGERPPIEEKLLRPAGYSLQCEIERLNERVNTLLMIVAACSMSLSLLVLNLKDWRGTAPFLISLGVAIGVSLVMTLRPIQRLRYNQLGLLGEQAVGEQLETLALKGYRIFHDIPGDGKWNIDHVAVGPGGVFAIETKCYSKKASRNELKEHEAVFDGSVIRFPWRDDADTATQARAEAKWLATFLSSAVGERVAARAIVALPGWWVTLKADSDVKVLSGKQVPGYVNSMPEILSPELIRRVAHQLEQRCRTVEF